jgi:NDP-sugar pyrophosphorylase family protein
MTIFHNRDQYDRSNVEAENGRVLQYDKRNRSARMQYIDYGLGVFESSVFARIRYDQRCDLSDVYRELLAVRQLASFEVAERFYEIGSPTGISDLEQYLAKARNSPFESART